MKNDLIAVLGRKVPLALVGALLLHGAAVVWWASARERDGFFLEQRVANLEASLKRSSDIQTQTLERLARIEERVNAQLAVLDRIERQVVARK
jgi:hypothetical protein